MSVILNGDPNKLLRGTKNNDSIVNYRGGNDVTVNGSAGNDSIDNSPWPMNGPILVGGVNRGSSKVTLNGGAGNDYITTANSDYIFISGGSGYDTLSNNGGSKVTINGGAGNDSISNRAIWYMITPSTYCYVGGDSVTLTGGKGNDTISNDEGNYVSIDAGAGNDYIINSASTKTRPNVPYEKGGNNVTISGGAGNDSIYNSDGKNILFKYNSGDGNDIISGFNETSTLSIGSGNDKYSAKMSGDDIIITVGKGKITLVGAASLEAVNINNDVILTNSTSSPVTVDAKTEIINGSLRTKAIKITGNGLANTIIGGSKNDSLYGRAGNDSIYGNAGNDKLYGSNGNDTLVGGKGNDTLWGDAGNDKLYGGKGNDVFIYKPGEGTDTIFDYQSGDMLKILQSNGKAGGTFTNSSFKNNKLTLAIDGGGKVIFDGVSKGDKININGTIHTISGRLAVS